MVSVFYKASVDITTNKLYYGTCGSVFKRSYNNHNFSFGNKFREKNTELPKYAWELKVQYLNYFVNWNIAM